MRSRASIKSHPIHPILVSFPIAFFIGTLIFDAAGLIYSRTDLHTTAFYLQIAGVCFALLAAVPGIIDFIYTVPPASSAKKRAVKHGITNTLVVLIFAGAWFYRQREDASINLLLIAEVLGVILLSIAGWMGGTLVYRNQIGVDPRYAEAGKWNEIYVDDKHPVEIARADELKVNQMKLVHCNGKRIVLSRAEDGYFAFDDRCSHKGGSLAGGSMICGTVQCPWHGSQFDVRTGALKAGPGKEGVKTYSIKEENGKILLIGSD